MKTMKRAAVLLTLLCLCSCAVAESGAVTLAQLKQTCPASVTFTIGGKAYVVPVVLPEAEAIPIMTINIMKGDTTAAVERYPLQKGLRMSEEIKEYVCFNVNTAPKGKSLRPTGPRLYWDQDTPDNNALLPDAPEKKLRELMTLCGVDADVRLSYQRATSREYAYLNGIGLPFESYDEFPAGSHFEDQGDPTRPHPQKTRGEYLTTFTQYLNGVETFGWYNDDAPVVDGDNSAKYYYQDGPWLAMEMLSEEDFSMVGVLYAPEETLVREPPLVPFDDIVAAIQARIDAGTLQSAYELRLGYTVILMEKQTSEIRPQRVVIPTWQLVGYDTKDELYLWYDFQNSEQPTTYEVRNGCAGIRYQVRFDARTGETLNDHIYAD